jgi:nitrite reductase/ring-hydroxylating ferredoxin subunit
MRAFSVDGYEIAVVKLNGRFYAFSNICTHQEDYLTNGFIIDGRVICGSHEATYDLETGAVEAGPALDDLPMYRVQAEGTELELEWPEHGEGVIHEVDIDDEEHRFRAQFMI